MISFCQNAANQTRAASNEKERLEKENEKLNLLYQQNQKEQNDLLVLCSTYEDQLANCRDLIQSAGLTVSSHTRLTWIFTCFLVQVPSFLLELDS